MSFIKMRMQLKGPQSSIPFSLISQVKLSTTQDTETKAVVAFIKQQKVIRIVNNQIPKTKF